MEKTMDRSAARQIAQQHNLGDIEFVVKYALNGDHGEIEVGYVYATDGSRSLFCKRQRNGGFYLCNEYRGLA